MKKSHCQRTLLRRTQPNALIGVSPAWLLPYYYEQDTLAVMTDRLHKSGFKMHATLLRHMFQLVEAGHVTLDLYDAAQHPGVTVRERPEYFRETSKRGSTREMGRETVYTCLLSLRR